MSGFRTMIRDDFRKWTMRGRISLIILASLGLTLFALMGTQIPYGFGWTGESKSNHQARVLEPGPLTSEVERFGPRWASLYGGAVDYSPDERRIAVAGVTVGFILNAQSYEIERQLFGHTARIYAVRWSPDGRYLASGAYDPDRSVKIWEAESGRLVRTLTGHTGGVGAVAWSPDGKRLASAGYSLLELIIWEASTGAVLRTLPGGTAAAWSPDGRYIASSNGYGVNLHEVETGKLIRTLERHNQRVETVAWSPDGQYVASGAGAPFDGFVKVWEFQTGRLVRSLLHGGPVSVAWSPDGTYLAAAGGYIKLWESDTGRLIRTLGEEIRPILEIRSIAWTPDSHYLLSGGGGVINLWDVKTGQPIVQRQEHRNEILAVAWSPDGRSVVSVGSDWNDPGIKLWDSATGHLEKIIEGDIFRVNLLEWSPDGRYLAGSFNTSTRVWEAESGKEWMRIEGDSGVWSPDARYLASIHGPRVMIWDVATTQLIQNLEVEMTPFIRSIAWSPDGKYLASSENRPSSTVRVWAVGTWDLVTTLQGRRSTAIGSLTWSPDSQYIAGIEGTCCLFDIKIWELATGELVRTIDVDPDVITVQWSPDGRYLASGGTYPGTTIKLWVPESGELVQTILGHTDVITSLKWSPDSHHLVSGSYDATLRVWEEHRKE